MISLKLHRDQARELRDFFFPFLLEICQLRVRDAALARDESAVMVGRMMLCLMISTQVKLDKKLLTEQIKFKLKLSDSEAICLREMLMKFPIDEKLHFDCMLRQKICDFIYDQLCIENIIQALINEQCG